MAAPFINRMKINEKLDLTDRRIALLDAPVDRWHPALRDATLKQSDFVRRTPTTHGTIAAVSLVGRLEDWQGLLPGAMLICAGVLGNFPRYQASAEAIIKGLHWVTSCGAEAIFLPFGHTRSHRGIARAIEALPPSVRVYAAAGNLDPSQILFPASLPRVIAVSAIDEAGRILPGCCNREEVDLFAPGHLRVPGFDTGGELEGTSAACIMAALDLLVSTSATDEKPK